METGCGINEYLDGSECTRCDVAMSGCATCLNDTLCTTCLTGYLLYVIIFLFLFWF